MLLAPAAIADNPTFEPLLALLKDTLMTPGELAEHWRYSEQHLSNMRRAGKGPPFLKLGKGAVRYRVSDVLRHELRGWRGNSLDKISLALLTVPGIDHGLRKRIEEHVRRVLAEPDEVREGG